MSYKGFSIELGEELDEPFAEWCEYEERFPPVGPSFKSRRERIDNQLLHAQHLRVARRLGSTGVRIKCPAKLDPEGERYSNEQLLSVIQEFAEIEPASVYTEVNTV